jgi:DNA replication protein DnaC
MGRTLDRVNACQQARVSGFPGRHCDRVREVGRTMDEPRSVVHRRVWASVRQGGMVMLTGDRGRGKTHLATLVGSEWWAFGFGFSVGPARYWRLSELFADQKAWFDRRRDEWGNAIPEPLEVARTCGLLVLDEIQERQGTDWEQAELVRLLDVRYTEFRPALLITNRTLRDVAAIVGMSAIDRMKEGGAVIECAWDNYRDRIRGGAA